MEDRLDRIEVMLELLLLDKLTNSSDPKVIIQKLEELRTKVGKIVEQERKLNA